MSYTFKKMYKYAFYIMLILLVFIVKVSHLCMTNFMNYIPIFLQLLKELPR